MVCSETESWDYKSQTFQNYGNHPAAGRFSSVQHCFSQSCTRVYTVFNNWVLSSSSGGKPRGRAKTCIGESLGPPCTAPHMEVSHTFHRQYCPVMKGISFLTFILYFKIKSQGNRFPFGFYIGFWFLLSSLTLIFSISCTKLGLQKT